MEKFDLYMFLSNVSQKKYVPSEAAFPALVQ